MTTVTASAAVQHPGFRRSVTVPSRLQQRSPLPQLDDSSNEAAGGETLFAHPAAKVVSFSAPVAFKHGQETGTLPWTSRSERVISAGPLRLYRLRGSVPYLHSGSVVLSLLPRSQCWCVDGESRFAMRIQGLVYRIELPWTTDADRAKVEELKVVLKQVLQYEETPCPFKRGFTVDLPTEQESPRRRRLIGPYMKAKRWEFDDVWKRDGMDKSPRSTSQTSDSPEYSDEDSGVDADDDDTTITIPETANSPQPETETKPPIRPRALQANRSMTAPVQLASLGETPELEPKVDYLETVRNSQSAESIQLSSSSTPSGTESDTESLRTAPDSLSASSSVQSFHTTIESAESSPGYLGSIDPEPPVTPGDPADPTTDDAKEPCHTRDSSTVTITPLTPRAPRTHTRDPAQTPTQAFPGTLSSSHGPSADLSASPPHFAIETPSPATSTSNTTTSPTSTPTTRSLRKSLRSPAHRPPLTTYTLDPDTDAPPPPYLITRTFNLLLGPPSGLLTVAKQIANRIFHAQGAGAAAARIRLKGLPGRWEDSESESLAGTEDEGILRGEGGRGMRVTRGRGGRSVGRGRAQEEEEDEEEDDFGVPLTNDTPARRKRDRLGTGLDGDWEVD